MGRTRFVLALLLAAGCGGETSTIVDAAPDGARDDGGADVDAAIDGAVIDAAMIDAAMIDAAMIDAPDTDAPDTDAAICTVGAGDLVAATLTVTTDDNTKVYVNGVLIDDSVHTWSDPQQYTVMIYRHPSRTNVLALEGINLFNVAGYDRGILADLRFTIDGQPQFVVTKDSFVATNTLAAGWEQPGFDDSAWPAAFDLGAHGIAPWGAVFAGLAPGTMAHWIWTYDPAANPNKPQMESTYARRTFSVVDPVCMAVETL